MDDSRASVASELSAESASDGTSQATSNILGDDFVPWCRFRGPNGTGLSNDKSIPVEWSDSANLAWKTALPGPGASSPVLTRDFVFVTAYSGYGRDQRNNNDIQQLKRHLVCVDRQNGNVVWTRTIDSRQPEDPYQGMGVPEHGYATNTPVTDGHTVFAFFGKSGVAAWDLAGNPLWTVSVGTGSGNRRWGSAASLMLCGDLVIVNAAEECQALVALEKRTGKQAWKAAGSALELCYGTPAVASSTIDGDVLVLALPGEIWGLNPRNGKLAWFVATSLGGNLSPSLIVDGTTLFAFGGYRSSGSMAIDIRKRDDQGKPAVLWTSRNSSYVATPVLFEGRLHWIDDRGIYYCEDAETGELLHRTRTPGLGSDPHPVYASPIAVDGKIYIQTRTAGVVVLEPADELNLLSQNRFESDLSVFNATPAVDNGQMFLRSDQYLYCVMKPE